MTHRINPEDMVLLVDENILVLNKPAGVLTIPAGYPTEEECLLDMMEKMYGKLWVVHRLDKDTSGVLIFARTELAHQLLNDQFERRAVNKIYHALVVGQPGWHEYEVDSPLLVDGGRHHRTIIHPRDGKPATTSLKVLEKFSFFTLIEARPHTGYTHQIRVHLASVGFPIAADPLYGDGKSILLSKVKRRYKSSADPDVIETPLMERNGLHARSIEFFHPRNHETTLVEAPYPRDFAVTLRQLRKYG